MPQGVAMIDMRMLLRLFLKQGSGYGSMNRRAKLTPIRPRVGLTPGASGSAQQSAKETQTTISIFNTSPSICRRHVTFQGPLIPKHNVNYNNKILPHLLPPNLNPNNHYLHRATIHNPFPPPTSRCFTPLQLLRRPLEIFLPITIILCHPSRWRRLLLANFFSSRRMGPRLSLFPHH
jgi:hypothetical protein